jgi:hypothetical protein
VAASAAKPERPAKRGAETDDNSDISGLAERIRRYANVDEPSDERPFGWRKADPVPDEDDLFS